MWGCERMSEMTEKVELVPKPFPAEGETTPRLRFPEFRNAGEWRSRRVDEVFQVTRGEVLAMPLVDEYLSPSKPYPVYSSQTKHNGLAGYYSEFLYSDAITWTTDGANAGEVRFRAGKFFCTNVCGVLLSRDGSANNCMAALLNSVARSYVSYVGNPKLMNNVMASIQIPMPSISEQRKIAECLQSLDELISAETEKLEAMKRHKKGLLQQLFPAEGETTPLLRFPQFRNAGEWSYSLLEEVAENLDNRRIPISSSQRVRGGTPYYGASGIVDYVEGYIFDDTLLCVSEDGANLVARSTPIAFTIEGQTWVNNHAHVLKFEDRHIHSLVEAYLNQMDLGDFLTGMAQPKLNRGMLDSIAIPLPSLQQEAASVAEVIITADIGLAESARRLNALHQHKDALMQQLFPSMEEEHPNA